MEAPTAGPWLRARFVWAGGPAERRNQFVRFERRVAFGEPPSSFPLHLFADTRYRLRVNQAFVATGPGRFLTGHPEYDTHELAPYLRAGENLIEVEVNFFGASSFQSMPDGEPGFIAAGGADGQDLATPGAWTAFRLHAWRWDAPLFSFAQNPVEICDTRISGGGTPVPLQVCTGAAAPWGPLRPYSGSPIPFTPQRPRSRELAAPLNRPERRLGFMAHAPARPHGQPKPWMAFATWIHAPRAQLLQVSAFWSDLTLNGEPLALDTKTPWGNHGYVHLPLRPGWNLLAGRLEILTEYWAYCLGIPRTAEVTLHAELDATCPHPLAVSPPGARADLILPQPGDRVPPAGWKAHPGTASLLTPARMMGWDQPQLEAAGRPTPGPPGGASTLEAASATWCHAFAGEFLGHIVLDVEAPEGSLLDVAVDDWQRADGGAALYQSNAFTDAADRFILRGGRQRVELFHPRGGKLIQATLRAPEERGACALTLHDVWVRSRQALGPDQTAFACEHRSLTWAWPVAMRTLLASIDEAYSDCPWRERGSYIGDSLVNLHLHTLANPDLRIADRVLRLFGEAQLSDGQLACCAPAWLRRPHEDFTLLWILALHDHWELTGRQTLVRELWPVVQRIWASPSWKRHPSGLWNGAGQHLFIDWGIQGAETKGEANAVLNVLRVAARRACATLARVLQNEEEAHLHQREAEATQQALFAHLWWPAEGRLRAHLDAPSPAVHANTLALAFAVGEPDQRAAMLAYLEPRLRDNHAHGLRHGLNSGYLELFYLSFALPGLARHGRPDLAEQLIADHYGYLEQLGDDTLPESFVGANSGVGSRCHSWSGAAAIYAARYVLGLRPAGDGDHRHLIFDPVVQDIRQARGRIAHPEGWIEVAWTREQGLFQVDLSAPPGVHIDIRAPTAAPQPVC